MNLIQESNRYQERVMQKSSICLDRINFEGFSRSHKWIGYFARKSICCSPTEGVYASAQLCQDFFNLKDFFLLGAIAYHDEAEAEPWAKQFAENYEQAKKEGFFQPWTQEWELYMDKWYNNDKSVSLPAKFLRLYFNPRNYMSFMQAVMVFIFGKVGSLKCFLISPKLQIALYPHDDIGFGVIALDDNPRLGIEFLRFCEKDERFSVHIDADALKDSNKV